MSDLTPAQRYYQAHKEQRREYGREYYAKNRDKILERLERRKADRVTPEPLPEPVAPSEEDQVRQVSPIASYKRRGGLINRREGVTIDFK